MATARPGAIRFGLAARLSRAVGDGRFLTGCPMRTAKPLLEELIALLWISRLPC